MQHYAVPTTLLDWTETLIVALYFACMLCKDESITPTIWVLNAFELENMSPEPQGMLPTADDARLQLYAERVFDGKVGKNCGKYPIPFLPDTKFPRLRAQDSCFTIHGRDNKPLDSQLSNEHGDVILYKYVYINETKETSIAESVRILTSNPLMFFPDPEGFVKWISSSEYLARSKHKGGRTASLRGATAIARKSR